MRKPFHVLGWAAILAAGIAPAGAQSPVPPTGPRTVQQECEPGLFGRAFRHTAATLQDKLIGYPEEFVEPPAGFYLYENLRVMRAKADVHKFLLYQSDFAAGTATLTPSGAQRLSLLAARLPGWPGPVVVEWTPDRPGLADARTAAVATLLQGAGLADAGRVVVGPAPYPGLPGVDAANNHDVLIYRNTTAPRNFEPLSPYQGATVNSGGP